MIVSLAGFMGCGKSTVGRMLSTRTGAELIDLDSYIEASAGRSIPEIFADEGEKAFRSLELAALRKICISDEKDGLKILSLGGGTLTTAECAEIVRSQSRCIYLRAKLETLVHNLEGAASGRPMLQSEKSLKDRVSELMEARASIYESTAHIIVDIDSLTNLSAYPTCDEGHDAIADAEKLYSPVVDRIIELLKL